MYYPIILIRIQSNLIRLRTSSGIIKNPYPHSYPCNMYSTPYPIKKIWMRIWKRFFCSHGIRFHPDSRQVLVSPNQRKIFF